MDLKGFEETTTDDSHKLWYNEEDARHEYSLGFFMHNKWPEPFSAVNLYPAG